MHFPHDNQGQMQPKMRHQRTFVHLGAESEPQPKRKETHQKFSKKVNLTTEGSAPGYEAPTLFESFVLQGSTRYMWWTSAEPKLAVSVTSVTNKVNLFFGVEPVRFARLEKLQTIVIR
jgi:hypothetical protein